MDGPITSPHERLRAVIQELLDAEGDGWSVAEYAVCMFIEKIDTATGLVGVEPWSWAPPNQGECRTQAVIEKALDQRSYTDIEDT